MAHQDDARSPFVATLSASPLTGRLFPRGLQPQGGKTDGPGAGLKVCGSGEATWVGGCPGGWAPRGVKVHARGPAGGGEQTRGFMGEGDWTRELGSEAEENGVRCSKTGPAADHAPWRAGDKHPGLKQRGA